MSRYSIDCRYPGGEEPIVIGPVTIDAESLHEAIGLAWIQLGEEVRSYGGTIDDLDGFEVSPPKPEANTSQDYRAVYAAALRDVLAIIRRSEGDLDYTVFAITLHATERGIDLDDAP